MCNNLRARMHALLENWCVSLARAPPLSEGSAHCRSSQAEDALTQTHLPAQTSRNAAAKGDELDKSGPTTSMKQQVQALRRPAVSSNMLKLGPSHAAAKRQHRYCRLLLPPSCCASVPSHSTYGKAPCRVIVYQVSVHHLMKQSSNRRSTYVCSSLASSPARCRPLPLIATPGPHLPASCPSC